MNRKLVRVLLNREDNHPRRVEPILADAVVEKLARKHEVVPRKHKVALAPRKHKVVPHKHKVVPHKHKVAPRKHKVAPRRVLAEQHRGAHQLVWPAQVARAQSLAWAS
jgi:hypothetical protein